MTVREYVESRPHVVYGKKLRVMDLIQHKGVGSWIYNCKEEVIAVRVTSKYIFIFIEKGDSKNV